MKRTILSLCMAFSMLGMINAQVLSSADAALVYYMPKTFLAFDVEYVQLTTTQGPFYQYAERYLGTKDVVTESSVRYELKSISLQSKAEADKSRAYKFMPSAKQNAALSLNSKGILEAYNATLPERHSVKEPVAAEEEVAQVVFPLSEETLLAASKAKMAETTAKQIYRIREARINILSGEVEHLPSDGEAMRLTLAELDKQEAQLVALFVGSTVRKVCHKTILFEPVDNVNNMVLFRFSRFAGPVAADDLSGEAVTMNMDVQKQHLEETTAKKPAVSQLFYNLPGEATVTLTNAEGNLLLNKTMPIAQFGVSVALPADLISRKPHIIFNAKTGAIQSIQE